MHLVFDWCYTMLCVYRTWCTQAKIARFTIGCLVYNYVDTVKSPWWYRIFV